MDQVILVFELNGHKLMDWPSVDLRFNGGNLWNGKVKNRLHLEFVRNVQDLNVIEIRHFDKDNDVLLADDGTLLDDRHCLIESVSVNGIVMTLDFFSEHGFKFENYQGERFVTNYLGQDGVLRIPFEYPMWKFWKSLQ